MRRGGGRVVEGAGLEFQLHLHRCTWVRIPPSPPEKEKPRNAGLCFSGMRVDESPRVGSTKIAWSDFRNAVRRPEGRRAWTPKAHIPPVHQTPQRLSSPLYSTLNPFTAFN